ncbi:MAG: BrnT family toxin [Caldilineaceae bacterium SB0661_bin_32]|uniref:BrnT family toxin n=1 Tax=Caldilineaceae bacterium SB0661_bin_32 TaxID=2605255 RepID=A0A6B1D4Z2_9CHLR|nr:BrnT family toxin [Caldilineaceae bacterium SB0661_bin_32]
MEEQYEWDENKCRINLKKHRVDFSAVYDFDWSTASLEVDSRHDEPRFVAIGQIGERLHVIVFTERGNSRRIISLRKANPREVKRYEQR